MTAPAIAAVDRTKVYRGTAAVDRLSFDVRPGTVTAFLGPNGAGKTTTIRMLLGLAHPDAGAATVLGKPFLRLHRPWHRVGVLIDGTGFHPLRTGRAHLRVLATAAGIPRSRIDEVLALVELTGAADKRVGKYSLGMRQRLGLAAAVLGDPDLLILDEPMNGLDPAGIRWIRGLLRSFAASGRTVFVSSHLLAEVAQLADEAIVINHGRLVTHTPVDRLTAAASVTVRAAQPERLRSALLARGASVRTADDGRLDVLHMPIERIGETAARERLVLYELTRRSHTLEDVFLQLTATEGNHDENAA
jgi:ABC-2 type transport system ATP-binding protein